MSDPGGIDVLREPGEAKCTMVTADIEGGRSIRVGARATGVHRDGRQRYGAPHTQEEMAPSSSEV